MKLSDVRRVLDLRDRRNDILRALSLMDREPVMASISFGGTAGLRIGDQMANGRFRKALVGGLRSEVMAIEMELGKLGVEVDEGAPS